MDYEVSIHTPTQGVTRPVRGIRKGELVSIHTPTQGVTYNEMVDQYNRLFQSTHPRRV